MGKINEGTNKKLQAIQRILKMHVYKTIKNDKDVKSKILIYMGLHWWLVIKNLPWASLVAQTVKNLPEVQETWIQSWGWEDPLEKGMATHSVFLPGKFHGQRRLVGYSPWGGKESDMTDCLTLSHFCKFRGCGFHPWSGN